jgi:hypothetical protein
MTKNRVKPRWPTLNEIYIITYTKRIKIGHSDYLKSTQIGTRKWFTEIQKAGLRMMKLLDSIEQMLLGSNR